MLITQEEEEEGEEEKEEEEEDLAYVRQGYGGEVKWREILIRENNGVKRWGNSSLLITRPKAKKKIKIKKKKKKKKKADKGLFSAGEFSSTQVKYR